MVKLPKTTEETLKTQPTWPMKQGKLAEAAVHQWQQSMAWGNVILEIIAKNMEEFI